MMLTVTPPGWPAFAAAGPLYRTAVFFARIVMPFSRSRSPESMARSSTCWWAPKAPDCQSMASTSVVFPWSTWATMATLRMSPRVCMGMGQFSQQLSAPMTTHSQGTGAHSAHQRSHRRNDRQIGWKPADGVQLAPSKHPQPVVILQRARLANGDPCQPHLHDVSIAKGPGSGRGTEHLCAQRDLDPQLLTDLTQERVLRALPRLDLPPWQLPPAGQLGGLGPAATEQGGWPGQIVDDRRADNG